MKYCKILIIAILISGCSGQSIKTLKHAKVKFKDLPVEVIQYLENPRDYHTDPLTMLLELPIGKDSSYRLETVNTKIGPWVAYEKLINVKTNTFYKIEQGEPSPYIIFENKLYIPDRFYIFTSMVDLNEVEFTCYELK